MRVHAPGATPLEPDEMAGLIPGFVTTQEELNLVESENILEAEAWPVPEIAARFHHRLTRIHAFANGNGRHARLMTDLLMRQCGLRPFTWGRGDLVHAGDERTAYIAALHSADQGDFAGLLACLGASDGGEPA